MENLVQLQEDVLDESGLQHQVFSGLVPLARAGLDPHAKIDVVSIQRVHIEENIRIDDIATRGTPRREAVLLEMRDRRREKTSQIAIRRQQKRARSGRGENEGDETLSTLRCRSFSWGVSRANFTSR